MVTLRVVSGDGCWNAMENKRWMRYLIIIRHYYGKQKNYMEFNYVMISLGEIGGVVKVVRRVYDN